MSVMWTEQLSIGNAILDSDHKALFRLAKNIDYAIKANDYFVLSQVLQQFSACMDRHFLNEELFACALNLPFALHKAAHKNIQAEIDLTRRELEEGRITTASLTREYAQFLRNWLAKHIAEEDMLMKPALQTCPYDFKIDGVDNEHFNTMG